MVTWANPSMTPRNKPGTSHESQNLPISDPVTTIKSPVDQPSTHTQTSSERSRHIKELTSHYAELLPSTDLLSDLAQTSEAITDAATNHDPTASDLIAFGRATVVNERRYGHTVPIVAIAGGAAGEKVVLILLSKELLGWQESRTLRLRYPTAKGGEEGWWTGNGSPIQQIQFSEAKGQAAPWLAVRYQGAISIIRPFLRQTPTPLFSLRRRRDQPFMSRLVADHLATLSIEQVGGVPFSNFAFNPSNRQQIVTIDQIGACYIWDVKMLKGKDRKNVWKVENAPQPISFPRNDEEENPIQLVEDGWGVIRWISKSSTVVIGASRRKLWAVDVTREPVELAVPDILYKKADDWILDLKTTPPDSDYFFVVTSSHVFWFLAPTLNEAYERLENESGAKCLISWRHFRNKQDTSLRLSVLPTLEKSENAQDASVMTVLLYSRLNDLITVYTFKASGSGSDRIYAASDPYILPLFRQLSDAAVLKSSTQDTGANRCISAIVGKAVGYESLQGLAPNGPGKLYLENGAQFCQLNILFNNLTLSECLCVTTTPSLTTPIVAPMFVSRKKVSKTATKVLEDFIIPDGDFELDSKTLYQEKLRLDQGSDSDSAPTVSKEDPRTISFEWLNNQVRKSQIEPHAVKTLDEILELIYDAIKGKLTFDMPAMDTLFNLQRQKASIVDIEKASDDFETFVQDAMRIPFEDEEGIEMEERSQVSVGSLLTPTLAKSMGCMQQLEFSGIYDYLIAAWVSALSSRVPGHMRIAIEKGLRSLAVELCLCTHAMRIQRADDVEENLTQEHNVATNGPQPRFTLSIRRKVSATDLNASKEATKLRSPSPQASSPMSEDIGFLSSSPLRALPTPDPTPSLRSSSYTPSLAESENPASQRLRAYASLDAQHILPSKSLNRILAQWEIAGDPTNYNWEAAQESFLSDDSEDEARVKQQQRAKKRQKRQRVDTVGPSSQPLPKRLDDSQPQQAQESQGSTQATQGLATRSQEVPGSFGGRPDKKKKKKKKKLAAPKRPGFEG